MTIKIENLSIEPDADVWLSATGIDALATDAYDVDILSLVRHIMRERNDCTMIPVVRAVVVHPVNEWGHNVQIEVTYHRRGYRAIYGAHLGERVTNFQCYMD